MATATELSKRCYGCGCGSMATRFSYHAPPVGETRFAFSTQPGYRRQFLECPECGHMMAIHEMDISEIYTHDYVESTYGSDGLRRAYERIISLPEEASDNAARCAALDEFARRYWRQADGKVLEVLDVGSGLCVFLHRMKQLGWRGIALDPDARAVQHAKEIVGVEAICGDFFAVEPPQRFPMITFNKVLEHVESPVKMLQRAKQWLAADGLIYLEVPDGEFAARDSADREEFFVEHLHAFSMISTAHVARCAGLDVVAMERLKEPSSKYTIRAYLSQP